MCVCVCHILIQVHKANYVYPLYTEGETYRFTSHRSFLSHISFVRSVLSVYHTGGQTRDDDSMSGYCWTTVYDAKPTLAQYWVTMSCLTPRCMWASVTDGGPTLTQLLFKASAGITSSMKYIVGLLTTVEWILASTSDAGPAFTRHWVSVGLHCLSRSVDRPHLCFEHHRLWRDWNCCPTDWA